MRLGIIRITGVLVIAFLLCGIMFMDWSGPSAKRSFKGTAFTAPTATDRPAASSQDGGTGRHSPDARSESHAQGMRNVDDVGLKFPWMADLLKRGNSTKEDIKRELIPGMIAPNVYYFWCGGGRWFEFKHYLALLSASKSLKVDKMFFLYDVSEPVLDKMYYNLWYGDLKHDIPFFIPKPMADWQKPFCMAEEGMTKLKIILHTLNAEGGLFIAENTWMFNISPQRRLLDMENGFDLDQSEGFVLMRRGLINKTSVEQLIDTQHSKVKKSHCSQVHHVYVSPDLGPCTIVKGGRYEHIWPMNIWDLDDPFGRLSRKIFYGTEEIRTAKPSFDSLVPNIAHMVWIGGGRMDFVFYLSVLSLLYVAEVDTVFIHGDVEPAGEYWKKVKDEPQTRDKVKFIVRSPPYEIYQGVIEPWYRALMSDIIRVDLMIKYGGIYTDTDAIWVKPLTLEDRGYEAVASFDWVDWSWPYPDSVNFGISYGKKNAPFWQIFRESMRHLHNEHHGFTGVMMPYKLLERYPHLLRIDRHLQVICYYSKCHPLWVNDYHNMSKDHTNMHSLDNWRQDINAFHWTYPNPTELSNVSVLMESTGIFADLGKFVLRKAGIIT